MATVLGRKLNLNNTDDLLDVTKFLEKISRLQKEDPEFAKLFKDLLTEFKSNEKNFMESGKSEDNFKKLAKSDAYNALGSYLAEKNYSMAHFIHPHQILLEHRSESILTLFNLLGNNNAEKIAEEIKKAYAHYDDEDRSRISINLEMLKHTDPIREGLKKLAENQFLLSIEPNTKPLSNMLDEDASKVRKVSNNLRAVTRNDDISAFVNKGPRYQGALEEEYKNLKDVVDNLDKLLKTLGGKSFLQKFEKKEVKEKREEVKASIASLKVQLKDAMEFLQIKIENEKALQKLAEDEKKGEKEIPKSARPSGGSSS